MSLSTIQSHWERNADRYYSLVPVIVGILFFFDFIFTSKNLYFRDTLMFHYPLRRLLIDSYAHGRLPLWNPFVYLGQPMLANPNYMAFYPTNLLHLLFPFDYAFKLHFIIHPILAGIGAFWLQRRLAIAGLCALGGALAYEFSGTVLSFLNLYNIIPAVALLPWIGWAFLRAVQAENGRGKMLFGILLALQVIAMEPLTFECTVLLLLGLAVWHYTGSTHRPAAIKIVLSTFFCGGLFAFGLAAIQVLPTLELLPRSMRGAGINLEDATIWSMHPADLMNTIVPNLYGNNYTLNNTTLWGDVFRQGRQAYLVSCFLGVSTILLAALSLLGSAARTLKWILGILALIGYGLAAGEYNPICQWAFQHVPFFGIGRYPSKFFLLSALSISILASCGLQVLWTRGLEQKIRWNPILRISLVAVAVALFAGGIDLYWKIHPHELESLLKSTIAPASQPMKNFPNLYAQLVRSLFLTSLFAAFCTICFFLSILWKRHTLVTCLFVFVIVAELIPSNMQITPLISNADFRFESEVNQFISANGPREPYRVFPPKANNKHSIDIRMHTPNRSSAWLSLFYRSSGQPFYGIVSGIQYSLDHSIDYLNTADSERLLKKYEKLSDEDQLTLLQKINAPMILQLSDNADPRLQPIKTFSTFSDRKLHSYWLNQTISRCYFVPNARTVNSHEKALEEFVQPEFLYSNHAILESEEPLPKHETTAKGRVQILKYNPERVLCNVEAMAEGYVVLLDSFYPGWKAFIDGQPAAVLRANYAFRAVKVPSGKHTVEFLFRPTSFYLGLTLSSLVGLTGMVLALRRREPRPNQTRKTAKTSKHLCL